MIGIESIVARFGCGRDGANRDEPHGIQLAGTCGTGIVRQTGLLIGGRPVLAGGKRSGLSALAGPACADGGRNAGKFASITGAGTDRFTLYQSTLPSLQLPTIGHLAHGSPDPQA